MPDKAGNDGIGELYITAETIEDVDRLADDVVRVDRTRPIVVLTSQAGQDTPALDASHVRRIVGDSVPVWFVPTGKLTDRLAHRLPLLWVANGAARFYAPGADGESRSEEHPVLFDRTRAYGSHAVGRFRRMWDELKAGDRGVPPHVANELRWLRWQLAETSKREAEKTTRLGKVANERDAARERAQSAEQRLRNLAAESTAPGSDLSEEDRLRVEVYVQWLRATAGADREYYPLLLYVFGPEFLRTARDTPVPLSRIAWVCAMVASGRAPAIPGLRLHALRDNAQGSSQRRTRGDGAKAFRCAVQTGTPGAVQLHYWLREDGTIELSGVAHHDVFKA